jgi:hypothetical protein
MRSACARPRTRTERTLARRLAHILAACAFAASAWAFDSTGAVADPLILPDRDSHQATANWAGFDTTWLGLRPEQHLYRYVSARWIQPSLSCVPGEFSGAAFVVGLDGDGSGASEETGTIAECANGIAIYVGFRKVYPQQQAPVVYREPVRPGDTMLAISARHESTGHYVLTLIDMTRGWRHVSGATAPDAAMRSAEVIVEALPNTSQGGLWPLADFDAVTFSRATVNGTGLMHVQQPFALRMQRPDRTPLAAVTNQRPYNEFTVGWQGS